MIADTLVLTPNHRLSVYLQTQHALQATAQGHTVFARPAILDWQSWLDQLWQAAAALALDLPYRLTPFEASALWNETLSASAEASGLLHAETTFTLARKAWNLVQQWGDPVLPSELCLTEEHQAFLHWQQAYKALLHDNNWLDPCQLGAKITGLLPQLSKQLPAHIILKQFVDITPEQQLFFKTLAGLGHTLESSTTETHAKKRGLIPCPNPESELALMAAWAKQQLASGAQRIACIIPNLAERRAEINKVFADHLPGQYDISAAPRLSEYPIIAAALDFLSLNLSPLPHPYYHASCSPPFLGTQAGDFYSRAKLDAELRDQRCQISTSTVAQPSHELLLANLTAQRWKWRSDTASARFWAQAFRDCLRELGWPGARALTSDEYQCVSRFTKALQEFANTEVILNELKFPKALQHLRELLQQISFQPQKSPQPVQVLGLLEAAGLPFDALWLLGMNDETWPSSANPNPFLPLPWQRQLALPHASNQRELSYCQQLQQQFEASSPLIMASFSTLEADKHQHGSPLLAQYEIQSQDDLSILPQTQKTQQLFQSRLLENYQSDQVRPLSLQTRLSGGSALLKLQAACPFRAFARFRLNATPLAGEVTGLSALERGLILHRCLELLWKKIETQAALLIYSDDALHEEIQQAIAASLQPYLQQPSQRISRGQLALEQMRLQKLLFTWMSLEKTRPSFVVFAQESRQRLQLGPYQLHIQIDRIDQLADGRLIMIDYKTGRSSPADWFGERPNEPQLPLYSLCYPEVAGLSFAQVRSDDLGFRAVCEEPDLLPGATELNALSEFETTWQAQQQRWRQQLTQLLDEFYQGVATVSPQSATTCQTCEFASLCRID